MFENDNVVRCYRGVSPVTNRDSIIAVKNGRVAPADYAGDSDPWLTYGGFVEFDCWDSTPCEEDAIVLDKLYMFELLWEKLEQPK